MTVDGNAPTAPAAVLTHLRHLLADKRLDLSARNKRFLRYVIEETLEGRQDRIKAYAIATEVFDRPETFDPQTDPVVRIEAGRIRRALERYYAICEPNAGLRISIPKGTYVPAFELTEVEDETPPSEAKPAQEGDQPPPVARRARVALAVVGVAIVALSFWAGTSITQRWAGGHEVSAAPSVTVLPFVDAAVVESRSARSITMTVEVVRALAQFNAIAVSFPAITDPAGPPPDRWSYPTDYVLKGVLVGTGTGSGLTVFLVRSEDWHTVWSGTMLLSADVEQSTPDVDVAGRIAAALASPFGVLHSEALKSLTDHPGRTSAGPFTCVATFNEYYIMRDRAAHVRVLDCLERAVEMAPTYAEAWAALSLTLANAYRWPDVSGPRGDAALERAVDAAERAVRLAPTSVRALHALTVCRRLGAETEVAVPAEILRAALTAEDPLFATEVAQERQAP